MCDDPLQKGTFKMKKYLVLFLIILCILPMAGALSEQQVQTAFLLRNGAQWGMSQEKIKESETGIVMNDEYNGFSRIIYEDAKVSNYSARLVYTFHEDRLVNVFYVVNSLKEKDYSYLSAALSSKYGQPSAPSTERLQTLFGVFAGDEELSTNKLVNWELDDGTYITLFCLYEDAQDGVALMYWDEMAIMDIGGIYNTFGL